MGDLKLRDQNKSGDKILVAILYIALFALDLGLLIEGSLVPIFTGPALGISIFPKRKWLVCLIGGMVGGMAANIIYCCVLIHDANAKNPQPTHPDLLLPLIFLIDVSIGAFSGGIVGVLLGVTLKKIADESSAAG